MEVKISILFEKVWLSPKNHKFEKKYTRHVIQFYKINNNNNLYSLHKNMYRPI